MRGLLGLRSASALHTQPVSSVSGPCRDADLRGCISSNREQRVCQIEKSDQANRRLFRNARAVSPACLPAPPTSQVAQASPQGGGGTTAGSHETSQWLSFVFLN